MILCNNLCICTYIVSTYLEIEINPKPGQPTSTTTHTASLASQPHIALCMHRRSETKRAFTLLYYAERAVTMISLLSLSCFEVSPNPNLETSCSMHIISLGVMSSAFTVYFYSLLWTKREVYSLTCFERAENTDICVFSIMFRS
jgi:hypothetical protein